MHGQQNIKKKTENSPFYRTPLTDRQSNTASEHRKSPVAVTLSAFA